MDWDGLQGMPGGMWWEVRWRALMGRKKVFPGVDFVSILCLLGMGLGGVIDIFSQRDL